MAGHNTAGHELRFTTAEAASLLGITGRTFARLVEAGVFRPVRRGAGRRPAEYHGRRVVAAFLEHRQARASSLDLAQERAALARAQREKLELQQREHLGELVTAAAVEERFFVMVDQHREALLSLGADAVAAGAISSSQELGVDELCRARLAAFAAKGARSG